jgi:oligopeptide/dipeptide ABC transporter ATP-binding protein
VTVQLQVLRLLEQLCEDTETALVFVTHDLGVVNQTCRELGVMYAGEIVERGRVKDVFADPRHPYTKGLLDSAPDFDQPDRELVAIGGFPPNLADRPDGCPFEPRCAFAVEHCATARPTLAEVLPGREAACFETARIFQGATA